MYNFVSLLEPTLDFEMAGRLGNVEKYMTALSEKLNQQQQANGELMAAIAAQQQQRMQERAAFANVVGNLQGTVSQLVHQVAAIPELIKEEKHRKYKDYLTTTINDMSQKIGQLGTRISSSKHRRTSDTQAPHQRSQTAGELLGKLLGKDIADALEKSEAKKVGKTEAKDVSSVQNGPEVVTAPAAANPQPLTPIDLQPQSHLTSLSTPSGQGPAGSASSNPITPNFSFVQVPSQTNVQAPSTPTGSGPAGSVTTMPQTELASPIEPLKTVSLTSVASKFKPPVSVGGYNVLPLVPAAPAVVPEQPLEPPGIISPQPQLPSLLDGAPPIASVPGVVNPYEVLTSSQMQPKTPPAAGNYGGAFMQGSAPQGGSSFEFLTSSQATPQGGYPVTKADVTNDNVGKKTNTKIEESRKKKGKKLNLIKIKDLASKHNKTEIKIKSEKNSSKANGKKITGLIPEKAEKGKRIKKKIQSKLMKDPIFHDLVKAMNIGTFRKVDSSRNGKNNKINYRQRKQS